MALLEHFQIVEKVTQNPDTQKQIERRKKMLVVVPRGVSNIF